MLPIKKVKSKKKAAKAIKVSKLGEGIKGGATKPLRARITKLSLAKPKTTALKIAKPCTKSQLLSMLAERTSLKRGDIVNVLEHLNVIIEGHLKKNGPGKFVLPGMLKMSVKAVPAKKARKGISPFNGETITFKAKPASRKVKITALKGLYRFVAAHI